jgi:hypothetical protein
VGTRIGGMRVIWWMCFVSIYKNRMKPVEIVLRRGVGEERE